MTEVTVYLNEARYSFSDGYNHKTARLRVAATFELDGLDWVDPRVDGQLVSVGVLTASFDDQDARIQSALNKVYEQLNVGGDIVPAEAYTTAYREAGNRSLSVGDVVEVGGRAFAVASFGFDKVIGAGVRLSVSRYNRLGEELYA